MSVIPIDRIKSILSRAGFDAEKCDIEKISKLVDTDDFYEIIAIAHELDLIKLSEHGILSPREQEQMIEVKNFMIKKINKITKSEEFMEILVKDILKKCVNGRKIIIEKGLYVKEVIPFDLSKWKTIGNFLEELSPRLSYIGTPHLLTFKELAHKNLNYALYHLINEIMMRASKKAPEHIRSFIDHLIERNLTGLLFDQVYKSLERGKTLTNDFDKLASRLPFKETLLKYFPDVKRRLNQDIIIAKLLEGSNGNGDTTPIPY